MRKFNYCYLFLFTIAVFLLLGCGGSDKSTKGLAEMLNESNSESVTDGAEKGSVNKKRKRSKKSVVAGSEKSAQGDRYYVSNTGNKSNYIHLYPDGSSDVSTVMTCHSCFGSGSCMNCNATGNGYWMLNDYHYIPCPACGGEIDCGTCKGEGVIYSFHHFRPGEAEAYLRAAKEVKAEVSSSGSSTGGSDYIDEIYYVPEMTGEEQVERYCEICGEYRLPHKHIKKRF